MLNKNRTSQFGILGVIFWLIFLMLFMDIGGISISRAQDRCKTAVADARIMYEAGRFTQAIELLTQCLPDGIPKDQRIEAYRILALSYFREDYQDSAEQEIKKIFDLDRNFKPDADDPADYKELVETVRKNLPVPFIERIAGGKKKWFWYGIGVVAIAKFGSVVNISPQREKPLPEPPALPREP